MSGLRDYFEARRQALNALKDCTVYGHNGLAGRARELFVEEFLRCHIPSALGIGTGQIFGHRWASGGEESLSTQQDIVIYRRDMPTIRVAESSLYFVESVVATIEVRSQYRREDLPGIFAAAESVEQIARVPMMTLQLSAPQSTARQAPVGAVLTNREAPRRILKAVVFYHGPQTRSAALTAINARVPHHSTGPDLLYSLESGLIVRLNEMNVLRDANDASSDLAVPMNDLFGGLRADEMVSGQYRRVFGDAERWRGLEILVLELAERCQRYMAIYGDLHLYCARP